MSHEFWAAGGTPVALSGLFATAPAFGSRVSFGRSVKHRQVRSLSCATAQGGWQSGVFALVLALTKGGKKEMTEHMSGKQPVHKEHPIAKNELCGNRRPDMCVNFLRTGLVQMSAAA